MKTNNDLEVGDFIEIPAWQTWGMVTSVAPAPADNEIAITLQDRPDGPEKRYRLKPDEFSVI